MKTGEEITPVFSIVAKKNSRDFSRYIYNLFRNFRIVMYLVHCFSRNPQRRFVEPFSGNTGL